MKNARKRTVRQPKLNNFVCPKSMTLEEWQIALRKQQAQTGAGSPSEGAATQIGKTGPATSAVSSEAVGGSSPMPFPLSENC